MNTLTIIIISLLFSALFSGIEIAFVSSNKIRVELDTRKKNLIASILNLFYKNREHFISTLLVGNNIALVVYGFGMADLLEPAIGLLWDNEVFIVLTQTIISTILILLTAEFLPKTIFRINPNFLLKFFAVPIFLLYILLYPISILATFLSRGLLRMFGIRLPKQKGGYPLSKIDLDFFIQQSIDDTPQDQEVEHEVKIFQNALDFSNVKLRECMIPRTEIVGIDIESAEKEELIQKFSRTGLSKLVVYRDQIDDIVGYIHASEMFKDNQSWKSGIKQIPIVPETMTAPKLMKQLMAHQKSIAAVVDEFGGIAGIVTLEDLVEEIFGDIEDEHDTRQYVAKKVSDKEYILSGRLEITKLNELFSLDFPESDNYMTIAGYILCYHQKIPQLGEVLHIDKYTFKVLKIATTKIELVRMTLL